MAEPMEICGYTDGCICDECKQIAKPGIAVHCNWKHFWLCKACLKALGELIQEYLYSE